MKPSTNKPPAGQTTTGRPATGKPTTGKPTTGKPTTGRPATGKPVLPPGTLIGVCADRLPGPKYAAELNFVEFAPRDPIPKPATLRKWRSQTDLFVALVAPKSATLGPKGALRRTGEAEPATEETLAALEALQANVLVIDTGSALSPGQRDRDFLAKYVEHIRTSFTGEICWSPGGVWESDVADSFATALNLLLARDPLDAPLGGRARYGRVQAAGARARISDGMIESIGAQLERLGESENIFITFRSERSFQEASRLRVLVSGA